MQSGDTVAQGNNTGDKKFTKLVTVVSIENDIITTKSDTGRNERFSLATLTSFYKYNGVPCLKISKEPQDIQQATNHIQKLKTDAEILHKENVKHIAEFQKALNNLCAQYECSLGVSLDGGDTHGVSSQIYISYKNTDIDLEE